jgi:hypothetical protein
MVFKGTTNDNQLVAVKRPIVEGEKPKQAGEFVDEITFQFHIWHNNDPVQVLPGDERPHAGVRVYPQR